MRALNPSLNPWLMADFGDFSAQVHDGNVLRFGHNPKAEREIEDEQEKGVFHRAERVSLTSKMSLCRSANHPAARLHEPGIDI